MSLKSSQVKASARSNAVPISASPIRGFISLSHPSPPTAASRAALHSFANRLGHRGLLLFPTLGTSQYSDLHRGQTVGTSDLDSHSLSQRRHFCGYFISPPDMSGGAGGCTPTLRAHR